MQSAGDAEGEGMEKMERARPELSSALPSLRLPPASLAEIIAKARGADTCDPSAPSPRWYWVSRAVPAPLFVRAIETHQRRRAAGEGRAAPAPASSPARRCSDHPPCSTLAVTPYALALLLPRTGGKAPRGHGALGCSLHTHDTAGLVTSFLTPS